eukprot:4999928-Pleurochrysis_carterae.AAC.1
MVKRQVFWQAKLKLSGDKSCIILNKCQSHARRALSNRTRKVRVPRRARLAEKKSAGFSPPSLVVLFVTLGGEDSPFRLSQAVRCGVEASEAGVENARGGGAAGG